MPRGSLSLILLALLAAMTATLIAALTSYAGGEGLRTWVRRLFLVFLNLIPGGFGIWRRDFSRRETFLATWFLTFILALVGLTLLVVHMHHPR
jgi:hypothetical protein